MPPKKPYEIEVFQVGSHTSSDGRKWAFSEGDIDEAIATHNNQFFRVPLIVSHDTGEYSDRGIVQSELAFGIVEKFKRVGEKVYATFSKIEPEFKKWVKRGRLHSVSCSFYLPDSPNNPYPGKWAFRHVAALGKSPPAVKGMTPIEMSAFNLSAGDQGTADFISTVQYGFSGISQLFQNLRDNIIVSQGLEEAEQFLPSDQITAIASMGFPVDASQFWSTIEQINSRLTHLELCMKHEDGEEDEYSSYGEGKAGMKAKKKKMAGDEEMEDDAGDEDEGEVEEETPAMSSKDKKKVSNYQEKKPMASHRKAFAQLMQAAGFGEDLTRLARIADLSEDTVQTIVSTGAVDTESRAKLAHAFNLSEVAFESQFVSDPQFEAERERDELRKELIRLRLESRKQSITSFVQGLEVEGRITPVLKNPIQAEFNEGKKSIALIDFMTGLNDEQLGFMRGFLGLLPQQVERKQVNEAAFSEDGLEVETSKPLDYSQIGKEAQQLVATERQKGIELSESEAVDRVMAKYGVRL